MKNKIHKIQINKADARNANQDLRKEFIEFTNQFGYEGDSIYDGNYYSNGVKVEMFKKFLMHVGFCTYYGQLQREHENNPDYLEYYTRDLKKISLFKLKYSL